uniref:CSD domain-containing protein n=1 Tax=viral metagenome TaxID=1070528 RepID=A0A6C0CDT9_9ZZZZ
MTEEMSIQEFGTEVGRVIRFFNRKGYGFIKNLNDDKDYFVHNSEIKCSEGLYRKLYPGEYVSFNLVEKDGKQVCSLVKGVMGYPLLIENEEHTFRVYPKQEHRSWSQPKEYSDSESDEESSGSDNDSGSEEEEEEPKEFINKEAPEGLEVADFDGLNINQEMS